MLRISAGSLVLGLLALSAGILQIAGVPFEFGRLLFFVFLTLAVFSFLGALGFERLVR